MQEREFIILLEQHQNIIHKICRVYMDDAHDREDLFQEIALQAWKAIGSFRGDARFSTWLYRVALNTAITFFRKQHRQPSTVFTTSFADVSESNSDIEAQVQAMYRAIAQLSRIDKALVMLYLDNYSYREMAEILGITVTNVGAKINRIKTKLKEDTQQYYHSVN